MNEQQVAQPVMYPDDEIDLRELFGILWADKWLIIGITSVAAVISVVVSLLMTEIYHAETVLAAADTDQNNSMMAQLGGAAALLGVSVGSNNGDGVSTAIATLRSHQFISRFIEQNDLLVPLFAAKWNKREKIAEIDNSIYEASTGDWLRDDGVPSSLEAYREFIKILSVSGPDRNTGIVTVAINWHNPQEAAQWVNALVQDLNQDIRARDVQEANDAIAFLRNQLENTQLVDMQRVFYQLIESQTRITMLADVRDEYVFRVIDPAVVPDRKSEPRRALICILGTMLGGMMSLVVVFALHIYRRERI
ncbi:MAG: LPS O-antigen length regulator [Pseudomonadales bacterium]|nr:LPS O-antigen length regulator [Pseudomonadales bacterium]